MGSDRDTHLRDQIEKEKRRKYGIMFWLFYAELMTTSVSAMRDNYRATTMTDFPYGNVGHDPYRTRRCVKISSTMPICSKMAYKDMWLPNFMQHESISEVEEQIEIWSHLVNRNCHHELPKFICSLYTPVCLQNLPDTPRDMLTTRIPPCRQLCTAVRNEVRAGNAKVQLSLARVNELHQVSRS